MSLLDRKAALQSEERNPSIHEVVQIKFMKADWMAAWGRFERSSGQAKKNLLSYKTRTFDALRVYYEAVSDLDANAITTSAGSGAAIATIKAVLFDRLAFQHDQLLEDLEVDGEDIFADIDDELTARGIDVDSVCGNQKRPNEIAAALAVDVFVKGL
eukprot:gene30538-34660_t